MYSLPISVPSPSVHFLKLMNLRWYIIITQCTSFTSGFIVDVTCSVGLEECLMTCIHYSVTQNSFTALKILCAPSIHSSISPNPWKPLIFLVTITVPFTECHTVGIIQYVKTLLLRNVFRFLHIFLWLESSFLSSAEKNSCLDVPPFIYTFTCWRTFWLLPSFGNYE